MDTGKLITLGALGIGLYILYEWLVSQCETPSSAFFGSSTCQALLGSAPVIPATTAASSTVPTSSTPVVGTTPVTPVQSPLVSLLLQAASLAGVDPNNLSADQWSYYYAQLPGRSAPSAASFESVLTSLGLTDATRGTPVSAQAFATAMQGNGLSGMAVPFIASWVPMGQIHGGLFG